MKLGSRGQAVKAVQDRLLARGLPLPKWGADGDLGWETWPALMFFAQSLGIEWEDAESGEGNVPPPVLAALRGDTPTGGGSPLPTNEVSEVVDRRHTHPLLKGRPTPRKPSRVTGIVLHQTATKLGDRPSRYDNVACHLAVTPNGTVVYVNDVLAYVWHAHGGNSFTIGIEIDGRFEGVEGNIRTLWGHTKGVKPTPFREAQVLAARRAVRLAVEYGRAAGCDVTKLYAHRQFSNQRVSDPGSAIWSRIAVWARDELGLETPLSYTKDTGKPISTEWDPLGKTKYRG
jgi:hypothetical protein